MSSRHESDWAGALGGWVTPGSGSTFAAQLDVHTSRARRFNWRLDGKSTLARSISVTRKMLDKLVDQAHGARPLLPLRFYDNERLTSAEDWVLARMADFVELDEAARGAERVRVLAEAVQQGVVSGMDYEPSWDELARLVLAALDGRPLDMELVDGLGRQHLTDRLRGL